ncbi:MAG: hypothetical protein MUC50_17760 [Myxococcota bacterium]|jgi:Fe-S-cluster containining protein|nr:hypothetical protein [Myxococcota bacterium]
MISHLSALAGAVLAVYDEVDDAVRRLRVESGLVCTTGCGACCGTQSVECRVLELLPLALWLWSSGRGESMLEQIEACGPESFCVLYDPAPSETAPGHCTCYPYRPVVCRLFGSGAIVGRHGFVVATCAEMRQRQRDEVACAEALSAAAPSVLVISNVCSRIAGLEPVLGTRRAPLKTALHAALCRIGMGMDLERDAAYDEVL